MISMAIIPVVVVVILVSGHIGSGSDAGSASVSVHFLSVFVVDVISNHLYVY